MGQYALRTRNAGYQGRILSFEPMQAAFAAELSARAAAEPPWECRRHALGSSAGESKIHISPNSVLDSLLEMEERHIQTAPESAYVGTERISVLPLDSIWEQVASGSERPFLKLDVQGFELEALRGAERSLPALVGVQCELSLVPLYAGAPTHKEVMEHLEAAGFRLAGFEPALFDPETAELLQADGIFVRD